MNKLLKFLKKQRVSVLSLAISPDEIHSAAMHYSQSKKKPARLYFSTQNSGEKIKGLLKNDTVPGSVVVGFSEDDWITVQIRGNARLAQENELEGIKALHYDKNPHSMKYADDPDTAFIVFEITWWRFSDLGADPAKIISGEN